MRVCVGEAPWLGSQVGIGQNGRWAGVVGGSSGAGLGLGPNPQTGGVLNVRKAPL